MASMTNITSDRIGLVKVFQQGVNPLEMGENIAKAVLSMEVACEELTSNEQMKRSKLESQPQLQEPKKGVNARVSMLEAFSSIRKILGENNINELRNQLHQLNIESEALKQQGESLLNSFSESTKKLETKKQEVASIKQAVEKVETRLNKLTVTQNQRQTDIDDNTQQQNAVNKELVTAKSNLSSLAKEPRTAETLSKFHQLTQLVNTLTSELAHLQEKGQQLILQRNDVTAQMSQVEAELAVLSPQLEDAYKVLTGLAQSADSDRSVLNNFIDTAPRPVEVDGEKWENTLALLTMLTASLKKAMNEDSIRSMKEQEEVMAKISEASRKDSEKKAKEAEEAQHKADAANKAASCASKIFSYVMLAVSVIATVATFGAAAPLTLAVAAIGIAISVTDIVLEETGNASLMQMLATEISNVVTDMLVSFGMSVEEAKKIGSIVGMVVAAVAFLALSLVSMSSFVKNIANTVKTVAKVAANSLKTVVKSTVKAITNTIINLVKKLLSKIKTLGKAADDMVVLTKLTKLTDAAEELQSTVKTANQVAKKARDIKNIAKAADRTHEQADSAKSAAKNVNKINEQTDGIKDTVKTVDKMHQQADSVKDTVKVVDNAADRIDDIAEIVDTGKKLGKQSLLASRVEVGAKGAGVATSVTSTVTVGALRLEGAAQLRELKKLFAKMMMNDEIIKVLDELLESLIKMLSKQYEVFNHLFTDTLTSLKQSNDRKASAISLSNYA
ncbi:type III secretion system translocon subunit SctE [Providencia vermicola]|uniref:Type III secretion system translocon subunit SctE n=1 Tax=Providencia vermicola TaxID=333965 RepID=A0AAX3RWC8_9GAMM|nr:MULTISPECIES: type III secretion system translocon subunit SctE [Providencia]ELX8380541.1 type III secretion system translocon subunit SctE [Providencia stuartii]EMD5260078.1 type III secretion system translocon subunit SctE [Providencia stuartii]WFC06957.1 type III secretion system translocon subunit SctE [Providencia vermicola]